MTIKMTGWLNREASLEFSRSTFAPCSLFVRIHDFHQAFHQQELCVSLLKIIKFFLCLGNFES